MNKKLFVGISMVTAVSAGFWACGEGTINEMTEMDNVISMQYPLDPATGGASPELQNLRDNAKNTCKEDMGCYTQYQSYLEGTEPVDVPESSSSEENQGPITNPTMSSSSRGDFNIVTKPSSSSMQIIDNPDPTSSADVEITVPATGLGSCKPASTPISKGGSVKWNFEVNLKNDKYRPADFAKASYEWTFEGGTPATGTGATTGIITYSASGAAPASLKVTMGDGGSETIQCAPLQVNGFPITCKCTVAGGDVTDDAGVATWTAACQSQANITGYTWDGTDLGAEGVSFQHTFAKKGDTYTPKLSVANDDNTVQVVECPTLVATDALAPDYALEFEDTNIPASTKVNTEIPFNKEACIQVSFNWTNAGWQPNNISVLCDVKAAQNSPGLKMDISYNGASKSYTGDYNISNSGIALGAVKSGKNEMKNICVTVTGTEGGTATCFFGN